MEVYNAPSNRFVAGFIGSPTMNFFDVTPRLQQDDIVIPIDGQKLLVPGPLKKRYESLVGKEVVLGIRPEHIYDGDIKEAFLGASSVEAVVEVVEPVGASVILLSIYIEKQQPKRQFFG